jgi:uncharacterized membrane protein YqgA involved in biofilm formation
MFRGVGTIINIAAIVAGGTIGIFSGGRLSERTKSLITDVLGCVTLLAAADAISALWGPQFTEQMPRGWTLLGTLFALILGGVLGSYLRIQDRLEDFGGFLKRKFGSQDERSFVSGFMAATLLFAIGPLAILGSISDGMGTGTTQLALKSTLDFFASVAFASTFGAGVIASIIPVGIYQGLWTVVGLFLGNVMAPYQVAAMTVSGGVLLLGISLRLLDIKHIRIGDLLPALFFAPVVALIAHQFM